MTPAARFVQKADVFVGMHSDEWADAMFLKSEAVALHLVPYGWMHAPGTAKPLIRGNFYRTIVVSHVESEPDFVQRQ